VAAENEENNAEKQYCDIGFGVFCAVFKRVSRPVRLFDGPIPGG
tara:strand:+ start:40113 stop:40244 length:132 start_codon:yes stop_codon:yes gene_type:complete